MRTVIGGLVALLVLIALGDRAYALSPTYCSADGSSRVFISDAIGHGEYNGQPCRVSRAEDEMTVKMDCNGKDRPLIFVHLVNTDLIEVSQTGIDSKPRKFRQCAILRKPGGSGE